MIRDPEFKNDYVRDMLKIHRRTILPCPARRHNKIGIAESNHLFTQLFTERLYKDAGINHTVQAVKISNEEILSRAVFIKNMFYGIRLLSRFEQAKGYSSALTRILQFLISKDLVKYHYEQVSRRSISRFLSISSRALITSS